MKSLLRLLVLHLVVVTVIMGQQRGSGFIPNNGQWSAEVRYAWRGAGMDSWLTEHGIVFDRYSIGNNSTQRNGHVVRMEFAGSNFALPVPNGQLITRHNYLIGNNPAVWITDVRAYQQVTWPNVYDSIDALFYHDAGQLRYDFIVHPGADPTAIRLRFDGATFVRRTDSSLQIGTTAGLIEQSGLLAYQIVDGLRRVVPCAFIQLSDSSVGFSIAAYDRTKPLVIDPLIYSTFIGGTGSDDITGLATDSTENPIICGRTVSLAFPTTTGAYSSINQGLQDIVVARLDSSGSTLLYATYIGGVGLDVANSVVATTDGTAWVTGYTNSQNFPITANAAQKSLAGERDAFLLALEPTGMALGYATYLGGTILDEGNSVALDSNGGIVLVGTTSSPDFPATQGAYDQTKNGDISDFDLFIARIGSDGALRFASFLGGDRMDRGYAVATNREGDIMVTGETTSTNFPTTESVTDNTYNGNSDAFLSRLDSTGAKLLNSGFIGGEQDDAGYGIAIGPDGNPYLCGYTRSDSFPTTFLSADTVFNGNTDAFVVRYNNDGSKLRYGLFLGGVQGESALGIAVDARGSAHVVGGTYSESFPAGGDGFDTDFNGASDAFVVKLSPFGGERVYSTFIGGTGEDYAYGIRLDREGNAIVAGRTQSPEFPTTAHAADTSFNGATDFFITKLTIEDQSVGVDDENNGTSISTGITISPNPSSSLFRVTIPSNIAVAEVRMFNVLGQLLTRHRLMPYSSNLMIDCSRFASGQYLVEIETDAGMIERIAVILQ